MILIGSLSATLSACGFGRALPDSGVSSTSSNSSSSVSSGDSNYVASWEKSDPSRKAWSNIIRQVIEDKADALYQGPSDVTLFCPMYDRLGKQDRLNFWVEFIVGVAKYESDWSPTSRMTETTMGIDPITGRQVVSEGLLQLSYQDIQSASFCEFDWKADNRNYPSLTDPRRSILNPAKNLSCGLQILNKQVQRKGALTLSSGVYWSTLKINGTYSKITQIKAATRALSFCK